MAAWIAAGILFIFLVIFATGWYFSNKIILPKTYSHAYAFQHELDQGKIIQQEFNSLLKEEVVIPSPYGYDLHGLYFPQPDSHYAIIISHGITWNYYGSVKYMQMFYKRGYSVLIYDNRNHGANKKTNTTFGFYEKHDLQACLDWIQNKCVPEIKIGLMGESLGAGISLQCAAIDKRVSFVIADCPYSDLPRLLKYRASQEYPLPGKLILSLAEWFVYLRAGFRFSQVSPINDLRSLEVPILMAHGANDTYIPPEMSVEMYHQRPESRRIYLVPNAGHAEAYWNNRLEYEQIVDEFLTGMVEEKVKANKIL